MITFLMNPQNLRGKLIFLAESLKEEKRLVYNQINNKFTNLSISDPLLHLSEAKELDLRACFLLNFCHFCLTISFWL
uniref:Uncharacterized protein n=1 Tax=Rhizophora mucronata TaxID=61149 RepID=A0A2P2KKY0_RHIMU